MKYCTNFLSLAERLARQQIQTRRKGFCSRSFKPLQASYSA